LAHRLSIRQCSVFTAIILFGHLVLQLCDASAAVAYE